MLESDRKKVEDAFSIHALELGMKAGEHETQVIFRMKIGGSMRWEEARIFFLSEVPSEEDGMREFPDEEEENAEIKCIIISFRNVTEEKHREEEEILEFQRMHLAIEQIYPTVISLNLTQNTYHLIQGENQSYEKTMGKGFDRIQGFYDELIEYQRQFILLEDQEEYQYLVSRKNLLKHFYREETPIYHEMRQKSRNGGYHWISIRIIKTQNPFSNDILGIVLVRNIDKRKGLELKLQKALDVKTEEMIRQTEFLRSFYDGMVSGLIQFQEKTFEMITANRAVYRIFHCTEEEYQKRYGNTFRPFIYEDDKSTVVNAIHALKLNTNSRQLEFRFRNYQGEVRWLSANFRKITNVDQQEVIQVEMTDITELIRERREREITYENIPGFVAKYRVEDQMVFLEGNEKFFQFFGTKKEDYKNRSFAGIINKEAQEIMNNQLFKQRAGLPVSYIMPVELRDGRKAWLKAATNCVGWQGKYPIYLAIFTDITEHKQMQLALEEEQERYRMAMENSPDTIFEYDIEKDLFSTYGSLFDSSYDKNSLIPLPNFKKRIEAGELVHENDKDLVLSFLQCEYQEPLEFRLNCSTTEEPDYYWITIEGNVKYHFEKPVKIIGRANNIDIKRKNTKTQNEINSQGQIAGVYRLVRADKLINDFRVEHGVGVVSSLLFIAFDNLNWIHREYGVKFANSVLLEAVDIIKKNIPQEAILFRVGEEEFACFLGGANRNQAEGIAERIHFEISEIFLGNEVDYQLSCSIGIVLDSLEDTSFQMLRKAKSTAVYLKKRGGNKVACYHEVKHGAGQYYQELSFSGINSLMKDYEPIDSDIVTLTLGILEHSKDIVSGIAILLTRIGKWCGASTITIVRTDVSNLVNQVIYQWKEGKRDIEYKKNYTFINQEEMDAFIGHFNEEMLYLTTRTSMEEYEGKFKEETKGPDSNSQLWCGLLKEGEFQGAFVYEDQNENRKWDSKTIQDLRKVSKIMFRFLWDFWGKE